EDGIRDYKVTGVQTCALPISEQIALRLRTALAAQQLELLVGFNALGGGRDTEAFPKARHGADNGHGIIARGQLLDERTIDLDLRSEERRVGKECRYGRWT